MKNSENFNMDQQNINDKISTTWIENLALDEINMEESGVVNFSEHLDPMHMLETSSIEFMEDIKDRFEIYMAKFNELRGNKEDQTRAIKMFKISNTVNDFMLFRNSLKLVVARRSADVISLGFLSNSGGLFAARLNYQPNSSQKIHEIKAHVGPFNNIHWKFNGENVDIDSLVRHYLTEFIKHSAR
ncbi:MAG: hypothetical protein ACJAS4_000747 [Bacteriovoracaceae bacterium]